MSYPDAPSPTPDLPPGLGRPALRALDAAGLRTLADVAAVSEAAVLRLHGVGPRAIRLLRAALDEQHLAFRQPTADP